MNLDPARPLGDIEAPNADSLAECDEAPDPDPAGKPVCRIESTLEMSRTVGF
jgi:hypothetical protein